MNEKIVENLLKNATAYKRNNEYEKAIEEIKKAYAIMDNNPEYYGIDPYLKLPRYLQQTGRNDEGWKELNNLLNKINIMSINYGVKMNFYAIVYNQMKVFLQREKNHKEAILMSVYSYYFSVFGSYYHIQENNQRKRNFKYEILTEDDNFDFGYSELTTVDNVNQRFLNLLKRIKKEENYVRFEEIIMNHLNNVPNIDFVKIKKEIEDLISN